MRIDKEFDGVLTQPFLIGDTEIFTAPEITSLGLGIGQWWYGQIDDALCSYVIKVTNTDKGYIIEQGVCDSTACDAATGACLTQYCCGEICDALEAERARCCLEEITSSDLDVTPDPDDCSKVDIKIKDGIIPEIPEFCFLKDGNLVTNINAQSVLFFCENGEKFGVRFGDLCAALGACAGEGNTVINEGNTFIDVSDVDANLCGMVIENGVIQSVPANWCLQFASQTDLANAIAGVNSGILSFTAGLGLVDNGTPTDPDVQLEYVHGSSQCFLGGHICIDRHGRVTSGTATNPFASNLTGGNHITVLGNSINHDAPGAIVQTLPNGTQIDVLGHVVGQEPTTQTARWCGNPSGGTEDKAVNITAVPTGADIVYAFNPAMPDGNWMITATDAQGNPVPLNISARSAAGFTMPNTAGQLCFVVVA